MIIFIIAKAQLENSAFFVAKIANSFDMSAKKRKKPHKLLCICLFTRTFAPTHTGPDWI